MRLALVALLLLLTAPVFAHGAVHARIDALNKQLAQSPDDAGLTAKRGALYVLDEDFDSAVKDFERAKALQPDLPIIDDRLAHALLQAGQTKRARALLDELIVRQPDSANAHTVRARAQVALGNRRDAVSDFTRAITLSEHPSPRLFRERADAIDDPNEVVVSLRDGITRLGPLASLIEPAFDVEGRLGHHDSALALIAMLPDGLRTSPKWLAKRAGVLAAAERQTEATQLYRDALAALDRLPASRRDAAAHIRLRREIQQALTSLSGAKPPDAPSSIWWIVALALLAAFVASAMFRRRAMIRP
jgi:tetratricopeptide (TPR) repeat protein